MSAHSYHASTARRGRPAHEARSSFLAAALAARARRFSFLDEEEEEDEDEVEVELAAADEAAASALAVEPSPSDAAAPSREGGSVLEGATLLFTAIASFPALSVPWVAATMGGVPGIAAVAVCGVATAFYSCWLVSYLVGYRPSKKKEKKKEGAVEADETAAKKAKEQKEEEKHKQEQAEENDGGGEGLCLARYHDVAAAILGRKTASHFVTPVQVVVCFGICVSCVLVGGQSLKALARLLGPINSGGSSSSSSSSSSLLTLSQWIAVFAAFQASSAFVPSLASSAVVAAAGSVAFLAFWVVATWFSAAAGIQNHSSPKAPPLPADFYSLPADSTLERAFSALGGLGVALFAWSNAFSPEVQATLRRPRAKTMRKSTLAAFGALVPCYVLIAALGYWAFGKEANVLVLLNMESASRGGVGSAFEAPRAAVAIAWLAVIVNLYALFAIYAFPVYECLDAFVARRLVGAMKKRRSREAKKEGKTEKGAALSSSPPPPQPPRLATAVAARATGRLLFCAGCTLLAAALPFFGDIAAVLGVLALALDFVLPCLMFLKVRGAKMNKVAVGALLATAGFYVLLGIAILVAAFRNLSVNAHTYKLFADI